MAAGMSYVIQLHVQHTKVANLAGHLQSVVRFTTCCLATLKVSNAASLSMLAADMLLICGMLKSSVKLSHSHAVMS